MTFPTCPKSRSAIIGSALRRRAGPVRWLVRWRRDECGQVAVMIGLSFMLLLLFVAGAVDLSRWLSARIDTSEALQAAVLAGARSLRNAGDDGSAAITAAQRYYERNRSRSAGVIDNFTFAPADGNTAMRAVGKATIATPFLSLIGIERLPLIDAGDRIKAEAVIAAGSNSKFDVEVALVLDLTSSLSGPSLDDMRQAAKEFVDFVVWQDQGRNSSRVALVPFAEAVAVDDPSWMAQLIARGPPHFSYIDRSGRWQKVKRDARCATERTGLAAFTDAAPTGPNVLGAFYSRSGRCSPFTASIVPLSADPMRLKGAIDKLSGGGQTAGQIGTAWAWYMLSPSWADVLPAESAPGAYERTRQLGPSGYPLLRKVAILVTDGDYNIDYCKGVDTTSINCGSPNGPAAMQAQQLCSAMKAAGITVYTVGHRLAKHSAAQAVFDSCASDPRHMFIAQDGEALKQALHDIAMQIIPVHVTR